MEHTLFSVCLLDLNLGGDDGRILINDLNRRSIPLVLATGYGDLVDGSIYIVLAKPFADCELVSAALRAVAAVGTGK